MPTKREREYYRMGFFDGQQSGEYPDRRVRAPLSMFTEERTVGSEYPSIPPSRAFQIPKKKRTLSAWQKFVKANSKKPRFVLRSGKLNLKKMGVAYRKTPAGKKSKRR